MNSALWKLFRIRIYLNACLYYFHSYIRIQLFIKTLTLIHISIILKDKKKTRPFVDFDFTILSKLDVNESASTGSEHSIK